MKYRISTQGEQNLTLSPTPLGRVRELFGGILVALPWSLAGFGVFFAIEYIGNYQNKPELLPAILAWFGGLVLLAALIWGLRRAFGTVYWEIADGMVRQHTRTLLLRREIGIEAPTEAISEVARVHYWVGESVALRTAQGGEAVVARVWWAPKELDEIEEKLRDALRA